MISKDRTHLDTIAPQELQRVACSHSSATEVTLCSFFFRPAQVRQAVAYIMQHGRMSRSAHTHHFTQRQRRMQRNAQLVVHKHQPWLAMVQSLHERTRSASRAVRTRSRTASATAVIRSGWNWADDRAFGSVAETDAGEGIGAAACSGTKTNLACTWPQTVRKPVRKLSDASDMNIRQILREPEALSPAKGAIQ